MKEGRLVQVVASSRGGGATHMLSLAAGLAARSHTVAAAMPSDGGNVHAEDFRQSGVGFVDLGGENESTGSRIRRLSQAFRELKPTLVHAHGSRAAFWCRIALRLSGRDTAELICSIYGFATPFYAWPRRLLQGSVMKWVCGGAGAVVACCEAERKALIDAGTASPDRVVPVPYGIDLSPFLALGETERLRARAALEVDPDDDVVLMICRLDRPRDFETLLAAFARLSDRRPAARLWIVGDGPQRGDVEAMIERRGLQDRVRLWGFRRDVEMFYAAADIYVLTSWGWEGLPISVIEAQASSRPVVVTDAGGSAEGIAPGQTGLLIPRSDVAATAAAISTLIDDPERAREMGEAARRRAAERFALSGMIDRFEELYAAVQQA